jgi:hypothetical protein
MQRSYTRQEFYDLVWSKPMTTIAEQMGCSSVWLGKVCREADIPVPERGYWARHAAGKRTIKRPLPLRFPGASNIIKHDKTPSWDPNWKERVLLEPIPPRPVFEEDIADVRARIEKMVGKVTCARDFSKAHRLVAALVEQDARRGDQTGLRLSLYPPQFATPLAKRWLRIVNAVFVALERVGCKPAMSRSQYADTRQELSARIGNQWIYFKLDQIRPARGRRDGDTPKERLRFSILEGPNSEQSRHHWDDSDDAPLESIPTTIVVEMILTAEVFVREGAFRNHEWRIETHARLEEEERQRKIEEERKARELLEKQRQERIDRMLQQAALFNQAATIRQLVQTIRGRAADIDATDEDIDAWARWAIEQADALDPAKNGAAAAMIAELPKETR